MRQAGSSKEGDALHRGSGGVGQETLHTRLHPCWKLRQGPDHHQHPRPAVGLPLPDGTMREVSLEADQLT